MIVDFFAQAKSTLDVALYDFRLGPDAAPAVVDAFHRAKQRGVNVRLVFNVEHVHRHDNPAPPEIDWDLLHQLDVPFHPVNGIPDLMHHKYVVRDAGGAGAAVLTGSANWTGDSWTREENVLVAVSSPELSLAYSENFDELWTTRDVAASGQVSAGWSELMDPAGGRIRLRPHFNPGGAADLVDAMVVSIHDAQRRIRVCSPVITAGPILRALVDAGASQRVDLKGAYDRTQMEEVLAQWAANAEPEVSTWKSEAFRQLVVSGFGGKRSTPYEAGSTHDFMHAKILVVDDCVFTGSFNLSLSGEANAENVLEIESAPLADVFAEYVEGVEKLYESIPPPALARGPEPPVPEPVEAEPEREPHYTSD